MKKNHQLGRILIGVALVSSACAGTGEVQADQAEVEVSVVDGSTIPVPAEQPATQEGDESDGGTSDAAPAATPAGSQGTPAADCEGGSPSTYEPEAPASPATPETLSLNQPVTGDIEQFTVDNWKLDLCAGQLVFFESLNGCSGDENLEWYLISPDGEDREFLGWLIAADTSDCGRDAGPLEIAESGQYTLEMTYPGAAAETGSYAIQVLNVPPPDTFDVAIGTEITPGSPEGAGTIESVGSADYYNLTLEAGQRFFLDVAAACAGPSSLEWDLLAPDGSDTFIGWIVNGDACSDDPDPITVQEAGIYTIRVNYPTTDNSSGATYGFTIVDASGGG